MEKNTAFICHESYFWHNAGDGALFEPAGGYLQANGSVESPESKRRFKNLLERSGLINQLVQITPISATNEQLRYWHTQRHIDHVKTLSDGQGGDCGDSAIVGVGSYEIACLAAGGAITAVKTVVESDTIDRAYVLTRPPGHHAEEDRGMGFCLFNNVVIAARYAQKALGIQKIVIIDWDAHHGNGTEDAFYEDDSVLFISLHQDNLEPIGRGKPEQQGTGTGRGYTLNIPLPPASGDAVYQYAFEQIVIPAVDRFEPELILISAGQDASIFDPLARMMVSVAGYRTMTHMVKTLADKHCQGRVVALHEGGYCPVYVPFCSHAIVEVLAGVTTDVKDPFIYALAGTGYDKLQPHQRTAVDHVKHQLMASATGVSLLPPSDLILTIKTFDQLTTGELYGILKLRSQVFVVEQTSIYNDVDDKDIVAYHLWYSDANGICAYLRVLPAGVSYPQASIGRVITTQRGIGLGKRIMTAGLAVAREQGATQVKLAAQTHAQGFYEKLGFVVDGDVFDLDGIDHVAMVVGI